MGVPKSYKIKDVSSMDELIDYKALSRSSYIDQIDSQETVPAPGYLISLLR